MNSNQHIFWVPFLLVFCSSTCTAVVIVAVVAESATKTFEQQLHGWHAEGLFVDSVLPYIILLQLFQDPIKLHSSSTSCSFHTSQFSQLSFVPGSMHENPSRIPQKNELVVASQFPFRDQEQNHYVYNAKLVDWM